MDKLPNPSIGLTGTKSVYNLEERTFQFFGYH